MTKELTIGNVTFVFQRPMFGPVAATKLFFQVVASVIKDKLSR